MRDGIMDRLIQLVYRSAATRSVGPKELDALLWATRRISARRGITGMLLYFEGSFFQVLEGEQLVHESGLKLEDRTS